MSEEKMPLPKVEHITKQFRQMRPLIGLLGMFSGDIKRKSQELEKQFANIESIKEDRQIFAARFGPLGWTIYDRLSVDAVRAAVAEPDDEAAEQGLVTHHLDPDILQFLGYQFNSSGFQAWQDIYERAVERLAAEDYLSAVPLILIIIDGISTTKTGKHPFSGGADAPVFDTETASPGGISEGLAILGKTRRKLDTDPINSPYRHGIVHGLNPNFGHIIVAAKAVNLLQTMIDYFDRKEDEEVRIAKAVEDQKEPSWSELTARMAKTQDAKHRVENWEARPELSGGMLASSEVPHDFLTDSPEATAVTYLDAIMSRNFGELARLTIDYPVRSIGYRAGRLREEMGNLKLTHWAIIGIRDEVPAISEVEIEMEGTLNDNAWSGQQTMRLIYNDAKFDVLVRGAPDGKWTIMPNFLPKLWGMAIST